MTSFYSIYSPTIGYFGSGPEVKLYAPAYDILDKSVLQTLWQQFGEDPFLFQYGSAPFCKEMVWSAKRRDLNPIQHLQDEQKCCQTYQSWTSLMHSSIMEHFKREKDSHLTRREVFTAHYRTAACLQQKKAFSQCVPFTSESPDQLQLAQTVPLVSVL